MTLFLALRVSGKVFKEPGFLVFVMCKWSAGYLAGSRQHAVTLREVYEDKHSMFCSLAPAVPVRFRSLQCSSIRTDSVCNNNQVQGCAIIHKYERIRRPKINQEAINGRYLNKHAANKTVK